MGASAFRILSTPAKRRAPLAIAPAAAQPSLGQETQPHSDQLVDLYAGKDHSPQAGRTFPQRPHREDTHLHTGRSMDAGGFGARLTQEQAWRFARGEETVASSKQPARLSRPLDRLAITEHSDGVGFITDILDASPEVTKSKQGLRWSTGYRAGGQTAVETTIDLIAAFSQGEVAPEMVASRQPGA